ncbi:hypothetical protein EBN88_21535 [Streptomyces triticirhizae]|uniref:Uncharacterized protein n=2 Tax=Streptomyces triticirhizae TaxID=2483353 RepID=A0A3M2LIT4_9ACTN|nr:hypothetical protein EBN88_21535 [Streptomyces triticirhizae]
MGVRVIGAERIGAREGTRPLGRRARNAGPTPTAQPWPGFVNRAGETEQLDAVLRGRDGEPPLVSVRVIAGTAGVGKSSLALHWAHRVRDRFPDGQLHINLRGYDPGQPVTAREALRRLLPALGVPPDAVPTDVDAAAALYRSQLADRRVLVVLDNAATASQIRPLLPGSGRCLTIVTSRNRLSGLAIRDGAHRLTLGTLPEDEAVALLRAVTTGFRPKDDEQALAELSRLCARLPLALRIAAERAASHPHMRLEELIAELRDGSALWDALGLLEPRGRRLAEAERAFGAALERFREANDAGWQAVVLANRGRARWEAARLVAGFDDARAVAPRARLGRAARG